MQTFHYRARDRKGALVRGRIEAENPLEAKRILSSRQLVVLQVGASPLERAQENLRRLVEGFTHQISLEEMIVFNRQLQTSNSVGLSILKALTLIAEQTPNAYFRKAIEAVIEEITQGRALHQALARHPRVFDPIYVSAIKAGEASGRLDDVLGMLSYFAEQRMENSAKVKNATFYPKIVVAAMVVVLIVVVTFVIPKFEEFYGRYSGELPWITLLVLGFARFFQHYWFVLLAGAAAGYWGFRRWVATLSGKRKWHALLLKVPVFGPIFLQSELLTFAIVLELLLKSGIPIVESMEIVRDSLENQVLRDEADQIREGLQAGGSLSAGFGKSRAFPKMVGNLLTVGEEGGKVEEVLAKVGSYYKVQLEYRLNNLSKAIEPAFLVLIFGFVLVLVLSIFLPIWKMSQVMKMH